MRQETPENGDSRSGNTVSGNPPSEGLANNTDSRGQAPDGQPPPDDAHDMIRSLTPYEQTKSIYEINAAIKVELLKGHPTAEGCIYGFLHPGNVRVRIGTGPASHIKLIKIGRSVDVERRMKEWKKRCKYEPHVVFNMKMSHHCRFERIIHHQLHNVRLREYPGCAGCHSLHNEWFRVNTIYAEHLVSMWQEFARRQPYDEFGGLLPDWSDRLEQVDLEDPGCWMWFILGTPSVGLMPSLVADN